MKRVGSIYNRDASRSKDRLTKIPLKDKDLNVGREQLRLDISEVRAEKINKRWKLEFDNEIDSEDKRPKKDFSKYQNENQKKILAYSQVKKEQRYPCQEDLAVKKMACLSKIMKQINELKLCGLKQHQQQKLMEVEDKLLEYERSILKNQKQNYL